MTLSRRPVGWILVGLLLLATLLLSWRLLTRSGPSFATLPVLVPASSALESRLRADRDQPGPLEPDDILRFVSAVRTEPLDPELRERVEASLQSLEGTRQELLGARQRRHELNTLLMQTGTRIVMELEPVQWDAIHGQRDAIKKTSPRPPPATARPEHP